MTKVSKEGGCEGVTEWIKPCGNHFYWSACSTHDGNGTVIWAKFKSFLSHIVNKQRHYYLPGSVAHEKVCYQLTKTRLVNAIKQASPISQTSCLEGFHSVLNHFPPKMIHYSFPGMYCRYSVTSLTLVQWLFLRRLLLHLHCTVYCM
jgi:hypothetical protein